MRQGTALVELRVHMQQDAIDGVHSHGQGWSGWMNAESCQSPSDPMGLNRFEMVVSEWRAVDYLPSWKCLPGERGAGEAPDIERRPSTSQDMAGSEARKVARPFRDPESSIIFR